MAKQKLYEVLKKYNANDVIDAEEQKANQVFLSDFQAFDALTPEAVKELAGFVKENAGNGYWNTTKSKGVEIDTAAEAFNKEVAAEAAREASRLEQENAAVKTAIKQKGLRILKEAARKVIKEKQNKEAEISNKKPSFADVTYKATKNQKEREESFRVFAVAGNDTEARKMLFDGANPMSITPRFAQFMEEKYPGSPALKLLYEKQLKTELDKAIVGRQASKETIVNLAEKLSPGAINDVMIDGKPMLTYVALNNPRIIDRVANIEGISDASKKAALIAVANRSRDRSDYNAAVDLIVSGAEAKVSDLNTSVEDALPAIENDIANLVQISSSTTAERKALKASMNQQITDLEKKHKEIDARDNRKNVRKDTVEGAKVVGGVMAAGAVGVAGIAAIPFVLVYKLNEHLSEKKYLKRGAAFAGKNIVKAALHSPQAILAAVSLTVGSAAVAIYYNSAKISNLAKQSVGHAKGALHSPVELARRINLRSELNKSDKFMQNMITKEFKELYEEGKKEIKVDKKDKKAYEAAKNDLKRDLDARKEALKHELNEQNSKHQQTIKTLIQGKFKDPKTGLIVRDRQQREEIIQHKLEEIAGEKLAFFDALYRGQSNYESIIRQNEILKNHKIDPVKSLADLEDRLTDVGSNRDTVREFISRFTVGSEEEKVAAALKVMEANIKIQGARHKDYETLAAESDKVIEKAMAATKSMATGVSRTIDNATTAELVEVDYQTKWDSVKDFAKGVYNVHNIPWEMTKNAVKAKPELAVEDSGIELSVLSPKQPTKANYKEVRENSVRSNSTSDTSMVSSVRSYFSGKSKTSRLTADALSQHNNSTSTGTVAGAGGRDNDSMSDLSDLSLGSVHNSNVSRGSFSNKSQSPMWDDMKSVDLDNTRRSPTRSNSFGVSTSDESSHSSDTESKNSKVKGRFKLPKLPKFRLQRGADTKLVDGPSAAGVVQGKGKDGQRFK